MFDTSFLVQLAEPGGLRALDELRGRLGGLRAVVPSPVLRELEALARRKRKAEVALEFARSAEVFRSDLRPDDSVIEAARSLGGYVASMDGQILAAARGLRLPYITLNDEFPVIVGDP